MSNPVAWFEVVGRDGAALRRFYGTLFDWQIDTDPDLDYGIVTPGQHGIGGGIGRSGDSGPGHLTFHVEVDDLAAYLGRVESLGGRIVTPPIGLTGHGLTMAFFTDPDGHLVGLSQGAIR